MAVMMNALLGGARAPHHAQSLQRRRRSHDLRRAMAALCTGVAVFAALCCMLAATATRQVVVAVRPIRRGQTVEAAALRVIEVPASAAFDGALGALEDGGGIAQVDIAEGQPLYDSMIGAMPAVPEGFTAVEVRLASVATALVPGDEITLASAAGCADERADDTSRDDGAHDAPQEAESDDDGMRPGADAPQGTDAPDHRPRDQPCTLVAMAVVLALPSDVGTADAYGETPPSLLAMPAEDALRVIASQEAGALVAVVR